MIASYRVYDKRGKYICGYSTKLDGDPLQMARMALAYHIGGEIRAQYEDGTEKLVTTG